MPEDLLDVVLAIVRDRPVGPVARITTDRTVDVLYGHDGNAIAEFCDDQVTAQAGPTGRSSGGASGRSNWPRAPTAISWNG